MGRTTRRAVKAKTHDEIFGEMVEGLTDAISIAKGEADPSTYRIHFGDIDVKAVRHKTGLTQNGFANTFGFSAGSVRDWEQGRVKPDQAARAYLYVIGEKPEIIRATLNPLIRPEAVIEHGKHIVGHLITGKPSHRASEKLKGYKFTSTGRGIKKIAGKAHLGAKPTGTRASRSH